MPEGPACPDQGQPAIDPGGRQPLDCHGIVERGFRVQPTLAFPGCEGRRSPFFDGQVPATALPTTYGSIARGLPPVEPLPTAWRSANGAGRAHQYAARRAARTSSAARHATSRFPLGNRLAGCPVT